MKTFYVGRLVHAVRTNGTNQYAKIVHSSSAFGIQDNWTISVIAYIQTPSPRADFFSKGENSSAVPLIYAGAETEKFGHEMT